MKNSYQLLKKPSKVQQLMKQINDLLAIASHMQLANIEREIDTSSKIVGELLQNDYLSHIRSMPLLKYITYELIIKLAERAQTQQNNILLSQSNFQSQTGTIDAYDSKVRNMLHSLQQLLQQISWQYPIKTKFSKMRTEKNINSISNQPVSKIPYYQKEIANLMNEYEGCYRNLIKMQHWASGFDEEGQTALIEQLQQLVAKKQDQIYDLQSELQKQRAQSNDIKAFLGNIQQQKILSNKQLSQIKNENINLKAQVEKMKKQERVLILQLQQKEKMKTHEEDLFQIPYPEIAIDSKATEKQDLMRFVYIQAISIDALIE